MKDSGQKPNYERKILPVVRLFSVFFLLCGIGSCIYDNTDDCPQGIHVRFYSKLRVVLTRCAHNPTG
ncbi:hypothetical protein JCM10512_2546 [Bacteroides reticulotermitis JCM 10512]|uniref:Uncharacterized protein n=2 Tax=Bacteroides reticulotermitis TaxID=1133319 RepID=W4UTS1_9BACE|nr:hypothetical protein JCM10512_2546 [Bacteroides reticulotermitis JCM 10512]